MDADEKLTALKKAYADIILNISKEAAARVMASERKALQYQHELKVTKEEALRILLRLKQMMDSKINESEAKSLNQQKKIDLIEAQLEEAEDIVRDLREELRVVYDELEKVKNVNSQLVNEADNVFSRQIPVENQIYSYQSSTFLPPTSQYESASASDVTMPYPSQKNECSKCYNKIVCTCSSFIGNQDLPKIMLRGKEPGLYRKGCTQRIHACERNLLDRELCLSGKPDKVKDEKNSRGQGSDDTYRAPASVAKILNELENKILADAKVNKFKSFLQKRKRANRRRKAITPLNGIQSNLFLKLDQLPDVSARNDLIPVKDHHSSENPLKLASRLPPDKAEASTLLACSGYSEKERNVVEICEEKTTNKDKELIEAVLPSKETEVAECSLPPDCKLEVEKVDVPSNSSSDPTEGLPSQPKRERVIKITFQRKRKRQAFSGSDVKAFLDTEKKMRDKQNGDQELEPPKSSLVLESSRDSRRLAQVARQLISLSEKKWWD